MNKTFFISIVIPVYNEERRITVFLQSVIDYLLLKEFAYEIVIVNDGSRDRTIAVTESLLTEKLPGTYRIITLPANKGKGAAIREGMLQAKGDYIFFLDADGSTAIQEIDSFMPKFSPGIDIYIATRTIKHKAPQKRKFFGYGYIFLANLLLGLRVVDITCGFKKRIGVRLDNFACWLKVSEYAALLCRFHEHSRKRSVLKSRVAQTRNKLLRQIC